MKNLNGNSECILNTATYSDVGSCWLIEDMSDCAAGLIKVSLQEDETNNINLNIGSLNMNIINIQANDMEGVNLNYNSYINGTNTVMKFNNTMMVCNNYHGCCIGSNREWIDCDTEDKSRIQFDGSLFRIDTDLAYFSSNLGWINDTFGSITFHVMDDSAKKLQIAWSDLKV